MLNAVAGLLAALIIVLGVFFIFAAFNDKKPTPINSRRRLSASLGILFIAIGVSFAATFYTGGLVAYLNHGGPRWIVTLALWARGLAVLLALFTIFDALGVWARKDP